MIFLFMLAIAIVLMAPLFWVLFSSRRSLRGRREAALALHRAQLHELVGDLAEGRINAPEYNAARLEVERRLLAADALAEPVWSGNARFLLIATLIAVPIMAFALYLPGSTPEVPSEPHAQWLARAKTFDPYIAAVQARIAQSPPGSPVASEGQALLAQLLAEQAGFITPAALAECQASLKTAPANAPWRERDEECIAEASQN